MSKNTLASSTSDFNKNVLNKSIHEVKEKVTIFSVCINI